jgi:hypothetical protein
LFGNESVAANAKTPAATTATATTSKPTALWIVSSGTDRPEKDVVSNDRKRDQASNPINANVVVFKPPAVDPGDPPIIIKRIVKKFPPSVAEA